MEPGWIFLDVNFDGNEFLIDEGCELRVSVRFGFQPSACPSRWSRAKVNQHGLVLCLGLAECSVYIFVPRYCHLYSPEIELPQLKNWMRGNSFGTLFCFFLQTSGDCRNHFSGAEPY